MNPNLPSHSLAHSGARAEIFTQGAHVAAFQTASGDELLYMSAKSQFAVGKPIRGGVPLIFPWFGPRQDDPTSPAHGFARTMDWKVEAASEKGLGLSLESSEATRTLWNHDFRLVYCVTIEAESFQLTLEIHNTGTSDFVFETALHTYLRVADVKTIVIEGLEGKTYIDKMRNAARVIQDGAIHIQGETDRVYLDSPGPITLRDGARTVVISDGGGVKSSVVWNPWIDKSRALTDLGDDEWPGFVCIESGVIAEDRETLGAGKSYEIAVKFALESAAFRA